MTASDDDAHTAGSNIELIKAFEAFSLKTGDSTDRSKDLKRAVRRWISDIQRIPDRFGYGVYLLEESSKTDISFNGLTSTDLALFRCLESLESRCYFNVFLAQVEKREIGTEYEDPHQCSEVESEDECASIHDNSIEQIIWEIRVLFNTDGEAHILDRDPSCILQGDVFENYEPDDEGPPSDEDGFMEPGPHPNAHLFCRYYRSLALVMVPEVTAPIVFSEMLLTSRIDPAVELLKYYISRYTIIPDTDDTGEVSIDLCELFFSRKDVMELPENVISTFLEAAIRYESHNLFGLVCQCANRPSQVNKASLSPQFFRWIAASLQKSELSLTLLSNAYVHSVLFYKTLGSRYEYILNTNAFGRKAPIGLRYLAFEAFDRMVKCCYDSTLYEQDGETLIFMACDRQNYSWLLQTLGPLIERKFKDVAFVLGFCWQLYISASQKKLQVFDSFRFLKSTVKFLVARLDVAQLVSENGFLRWQQKRASPDGSGIPPPPPPVTSLTLLNLCVLLLKLDMLDDLRDLARKITEQSERIDPPEFADLFVPFVGNLMDVLENQPVPFEDPAISLLVGTVVKLFWARYVMIGEPGPREQHNEVLLHCSCLFCKSMNSRFISLDGSRWSFTCKEPEDKKHVDGVLQELNRQSRCTYTSFEDGIYRTWMVTILLTKYEKSKADWERRVIGARHQLAAFNQIKLRQILGADYYYITGQEIPNSGSSRANPMIGPSSSMPTGLPEHTATMPQIAASRPILQYPIAGSLPSLVDTSNMPVYFDEPTQQAYHNIQQPRCPPQGARFSGVASPITNISSPAQTAMAGSLQAQNRLVESSQDMNSPSGRLPLSPFSQNPTRSPWSEPSQTGGLPPITGLKRKQSDGCVFISERPAKR